MIEFYMSTGAIDLMKSGIPKKTAIEIEEKYRKYLTVQSFSSLTAAEASDILSPFVDLFPNGTYRIKLTRVKAPFHIVPGQKNQNIEEHKVVEAEFEEVDWPGIWFPRGRQNNNDAERKICPRGVNLLLSTQDIGRCLKSRVSFYKNMIESNDILEWPLILTFKEPTNYPRLQHQYRYDSEGSIDSILFFSDTWILLGEGYWFNGNGKFFSGCNQYILDGHHKAIAYKNSPSLLPSSKLKHWITLVMNITDCFNYQRKWRKMCSRKKNRSNKRKKNPSSKFLNIFAGHMIQISIEFRLDIKATPLEFRPAGTLWYLTFFWPKRICSNLFRTIKTSLREFSFRSFRSLGAIMTTK